MVVNNWLSIIRLDKEKKWGRGYKYFLIKGSDQALAEIIKEAIKS